MPVRSYVYLKLCYVWVSTHGGCEGFIVPEIKIKMKMTMKTLCISWIGMLKRHVRCYDLK